MPLHMSKRKICVVNSAEGWLGTSNHMHGYDELGQSKPKPILYKRLGGL